jgi:hypothetical protein
LQVNRRYRYFLFLVFDYGRADNSTISDPVTPRKKKTQMDIYTVIIMGLLITAISWYLTICITEERRLIKENNQMKQKDRERVKRLRELTKKT